MAQSRAQQRRGGGRPSPGDFTGRVKEQSAREQAKAVEDRSAEVSMQNAAEAEQLRDGVFDGQSGIRLDSPGDAHTVHIVGDEEDDEGDQEEEAPSFPERLGGAFVNREPVFSGQEDPQELVPVSARKTFSPPPQRVHSQMVVVRVDQDIDDMTYGMRNGEPNNYSFKEGVQYRIPYGVAEHLNERSLIRQWITS